MSKIDDLIKQYCPNGVKSEELRAVCKFQNGYAFKSSLFKTDGLPILRITNIQNKGIDVSNLVYFNIEDYDTDLEQFKVVENDILIAMSGATTGKIGISKSKEIFYLNQRVGKFIPNKKVLLNGFLYHFIQTKSQEILAISKGNGSQPNLSSEKLKKIKIPVPPLPVQEEIVKVLDAFTALEAELEARKRQYEYYRNKLLTFDENKTGGRIKFMQLGDVGTFIRGNGLQKKDFTDTGIGCIHYGQIYTYYGTFAERTKSYVSNELAEKLKKARTGDLIIATTSENVEDVGKAVAWLGDENICISGDAFIYHHNQNPKYMSYLFQTNSFFEQKKKCITGVKVMRINDVAMSKFKFGFPPIEEQERIVAILDKFDSLVNDISEGLPAELTARRQQYEYYRNKLLTFEEAA